VQAVTSADVSSAASRYLDPQNAVTLIVGDNAVVHDSLLTLGLGTPDVLPPSTD